LYDNLLILKLVYFLADSSKIRAYATVLRLSVCPSVVCNVYIVAERCVVEQK